MRQRSPALRALVTPAHAVAVLLVVFPLIDLVVNVWPPRIGELRWRYGTTGLLSGFLLTSLLGLLVMAVTANIAGQRRLLRVLGWVGWIGGLVLLAAIALFSLDVLQLRSAVPPAAKGVFAIGAVKAAVKLVIMAGWLVLFGRGALRAARSLLHQSGEGREGPDLLISSTRPPG